MTPTLQTFTRALLTPDISFATLGDARVETDACGLPLIMRTTRFAEARILWQGERWLLSMPLTPAAMRTIEQTTSQLRRLNTTWLTRYCILSGELRWHDYAGELHTTELVLQHMPAGKTFAEALLVESPQTLLNALDALQQALRELGFAHNNLKAENLLFGGGRLVALRYHDAGFGCDTSERDTVAFEALRRMVSESPEPQTLCDTTATYDPLCRLTGHRWTSSLFEGLVCVEDDGGFGFVDPDNHPIIAAQYLWTGDFREGRAEVETSSGMGLIDRHGHYIIPPEYEIVDYDPITSVIHVRHRGQWALFDYLGRRLTEFGTKNEYQTENI